MMSLQALIAATPFAILGIHMARLARARGAAPERLLAGLFGCIAVGIPLRMTGVDLAVSGGSGSDVVFWCATLGNAVVGAGLVCLAAFSWKVFRPGDAWAKRLVIAFAAVMAVVMLGGASSPEASSGSGLWAIAFNGVGVSAIAWAFVECLVYHRMMRRRRAVGLIDPVVENRFLLWSIWTGAFVFQGCVGLTLRIAVRSSGAGELIAAGLDPGGHWVAVIQTAKLTLVPVAIAILCGIWLSFSPPAAYRRWLGATQG